MIVYKCLHGWAPSYLAVDCLAISTIAGKRHLRTTLRTQDKDHAGDEEFRGRRSSYLEQSTWHPANCNSLPLDVCWTSEGSPVWFTEGARLRIIYDALYKSTYHHHHLALFRRYSIPNVQNRYYSTTPLPFKPPDGGFPGMISVKFSVDVNRWPLRYLMAKKTAENFNRLTRAHERYRRQTDWRVIAYSERERESLKTTKTYKHFLVTFIAHIPIQSRKRR